MLIRAALIARSPVARRVRRLAPGSGVRWTVLDSRRDALPFLATEPCDIVLAESLPKRHGPLEILRTLQERRAPAEFVFLSAREDAVGHAQLLAAGGMAVVDLGLEDEPLAAILESLFARCLELQANRRTARDVTGQSSLSDFATNSPAMRKFLALCRRVVDVDSPLLVLGETGVGKEYVARAVHAAGPRKGGPFIAINCGALPEALFEAELFGHERGAFTGADRTRRGAFELAHGGSLFLDEIGELPLHLQVKLLRALQDGQIQPVGSEHEVQIDVRVIAATNRDLREEVATKRFRADLFYRLDVVSLLVPSLRSRHEDIQPLVETHVTEFCRKFARPSLRVSEAALTALRDYSWPGNVRELINVIERAVLLCDTDAIEPDDLPDSVHQASRPDSSLEIAPHADLYDLPLRDAVARIVRDFERDYLLRLLHTDEGHLGTTARRAGLSPRGLYGMMRRLGIDPPTAASSGADPTRGRSRSVRAD